jgi:DNA-binding CsgD family transcriptional regulator
LIAAQENVIPGPPDADVGAERGSGPLSLPVRDALEIIADSRTPAYGMDRYDRIVYWNEGAEKALGWTSGEVLGKMCYDVLAGRDVFGNRYCTRECPVVVSAIAGNELKPFMIDSRKKDSETPVRLVVRCVPLPAAGPSFAVLMHFLEAEGEALEGLISSIRSAVREPAGIPPADPPISVSPLSTREREILVLLSKGYAALNISAKLNLSLATVRNHINNVLHELDVHSQLEAVALSFRRGWI